MKRVLIVGAGFTGAVIARELAEAGFRSLVIDENKHVAGHCYTERDPTGIMLHKFGPHIFNTNDDEVWAYVQRFGNFRPFINRVKAVNKHGVFSFPINLHTINQFFDTRLDPTGARNLIESVRENIPDPQNFEEQALAMIGRELYEAFMKHYTIKAWGRDPREIPASVLKRLPLRFDYNDNYYNVRYQAIPEEGYTAVVQRILNHENIEVKLGQTFDEFCFGPAEFVHVFYTGAIDAYFGYQYGRLSYRTLDFSRVEDEGDMQGSAVINFTDDTVDYTRVSEHKHFAPWESHRKSVVLVEKPREATGRDALYYPVRGKDDVARLEEYQHLALHASNLTFCGRLGRYQYFDMDDVIRDALDTARRFLKRGENLCSRCATAGRVYCPHR